MNTETRTALSAGTRALQEAASLLLQFQYAICRDDESEADRLRDEMEAPFYRLSHAEQRLLNNLSGDLEMLCDQEVFEPNDIAREEYATRFEQAWRNITEDPHAVLALLRRKQDVLSSGQVAYARSRAYRLLGLPEIGLEFLRFGMKCEPENTVYRVFVLDQLRALGRNDEAWEVAQDLFADPNADPGTVVHAVGTSYLIMDEQGLGGERHRVGRLRQIVENLLRTQSLETMDPKTASLALLLLGQLLEQLRRRAEAQRCYRDAVRINPNDSALLVTLGGSLYRTNPEEAREYLKRAVALGTHDVVPYLVIAAHEGENGNYQRCRQLCETVMRLTEKPSILAHAYEWLALCELLTNGPTEEAERCFQEARQLNPQSDTLSSNYQAFLAAKALEGSTIRQAAFMQILGRWARAEGSVGKHDLSQQFPSSPRQYFQEMVRADVPVLQMSLAA